MAEPPVTPGVVHHDNGVNDPVTRIVIHATCGGRKPFPAESAAGVAAATDRYFLTPAAGGSAHYICDAATEVHSAADSTICWHAPPNKGSIGIEICGEATYTRDQWLDARVWPAVARAAARTAELCDRHGVPRVKLAPADLLAGRHGICGHVDVSQAWRQSTHTDPGPGFPWDRFMALLAAPTALEGDDMPYNSWPAADKAQLIADVWSAQGDPTQGKGVWIADRIIATNQRTDEVSTKVDALVGAVTALLKATPATPAAAAGGVDYARLAAAVCDELDRRARDNNPATGPVS